MIVQLSLLPLRFMCYILLSSPCFGRNFQLYRLVDRNLGCDPSSRISSLTADSLPLCASVCKLNQNCGMFSIDDIGENNSTNSKKRQLTCELCKSTNISNTIGKEGWSIYVEWLREAKFHVLDTDNRSLQTNLPPEEPWNIDCNIPEVTNKRNGILVGIWDDKDKFRDLDKIKCFNWGEKDIFSDKPSRLLHIHLEDYRQCPKNYVLTAITASNAAFRNVDKGKCTLLAPPYQVDYERCITVTSEEEDGGTFDRWKMWKVQCPFSGPYVAVSLHRRRRIHTGLKCCILDGLLE